MNSYVIVVVPPPKICKFVDEYRQKYAKYTEYVIPPHITIYPPFYFKDLNEKEVIKILQEKFLDMPSLKVTCQSINYFEGSKNNVAYFELDKNSALYMKKLLAKAIEALKDRTTYVYASAHLYTPPKFIPHMTIAEKIPSNVLPSAKKELASFKDKITFKVSSVFLYKQKGDSVVWGEVTEIKF